MRDVVATLGIVVGSALAVSFASHTDAVFTSLELFRMFGHTGFIVYAVSIVLAVGTMWWIIQWLETMQLDPDQVDRYIAWRGVHRFLYPALSGIAGAQSVLFAKVNAMLVANSVAGQTLFLEFWQSYFTLACMFTAIVLQIKWLNSGLVC